MKKTVSIVLIFCGLIASGQSLINSSYKNESAEKVLRFECTLPINLNTAWDLFTKDNKLQKWIAPLAHIELKTGGFLITNYNKTKSLNDTSSIKLTILSYIEKELLILKVDLNNNFPSSTRMSDQNLQEVIQFIKIDNDKTKIISSMIGWGEGEEWDKVYNFFLKGNEWTYQELIKVFK